MKDTLVITLEKLDNGARIVTAHDEHDVIAARTGHGHLRAAHRRATLALDRFFAAVEKREAKKK